MRYTRCIWLVNLEIHETMMEILQACTTAFKVSQLRFDAPSVAISHGDISCFGRCQTYSCIHYLEGTVPRAFSSHTVVINSKYRDGVLVAPLWPTPEIPLMVNTRAAGLPTRKIIFCFCCVFRKLPPATPRGTQHRHYVIFEPSNALYKRSLHTKALRIVLL